MAENGDILIEADRLSRRFPRCDALSAVSFAVRRGETAGLLGPNGSGKTTTLRLLAGALAPTSGVARLAGLDITTRPLEARRRIGYLPGAVPLYSEMRVSEYLEFRGRLKGLRRARLTLRLRETIEQCGLGESLRRTIGTLSRGFRQRVGLADCLLHSPDILLMDEPMAGLDAAQAHAMHRLLRELVADRAILFSTHTLSEAEDLCHRVIILNAGQLVANNSPAALLADAAATDAPPPSFAELFLRLTATLPKVAPSGKRRPA